MRPYVRARQLLHNLHDNGTGPTLYKVYFYLLGYSYDYLSGRLDTTSPQTIETLAADGRPKGDRSAAFPCHPLVLRKALKSLDITPEDVFIDIGCGKGRALVEAARFPFKRLVGIDLIASHITIARSNLEKAGHRGSELIQGDALQISYPQDATICFLFKPFPEEVICDCLLRLKGSLRAIILMGCDNLRSIEGYHLSRCFLHRPCSRFNTLIFERKDGDQEEIAADSLGLQPDAA